MKITQAPLCFEVRELLGFEHEGQIVEIEWPMEAPAVDALTDERSGREFPLQLAKERPGAAYLQLELKPHERLRLTPSDRGTGRRTEERPRINGIRYENGLAYLTNGRIELEVPFGLRQFGNEPIGLGGVPGPVCRMRSAGGTWRGRSYIDARGASTGWEGRILEVGPLRTVYEYRLEFAAGGRYAAKLTLDADQLFTRLEETFDTEPGAQLVWDFSGADLPELAYLLDPTPASRPVRLLYHLDQRLARLAAWTQYSQLLDMSDGFAFRFSHGEDAVGFVTLDGGDWRGNRHNHAELWMRRWEHNDPRTRKDTPGDVKADFTARPDRIPARGESVNVPHLSVEAWIVRGHRRSALVIADADFVRGGGLRRLQTRRGVASLEAMTRMKLSLPSEEEPASSAFRYPNPVLESHFARLGGTADSFRQARMIAYLGEMTQGFWHGAGSAHVNCVAGRMIAPYMYLYEYLVSQELLTEGERESIGAQLLFLAYLYASDHYYIGRSTMLPVGSDDTTEPTLAGMANQNFYTDIINVFATAAQLFPKHPEADSWRGKFQAMWSRQLEVHMYPESGVWEESHTYYHHVLYTLLPTLLRLRDDGAGDEFRNPAFRKLVGATLRQLTPRAAEFDNARHVLAFGDHQATTSYVPQYAEFALALEPHDPKLAGQLAWAYREMKGTHRLPVDEVPVRWENEYVQGLGYMFRSLGDDGRESLLALRSGCAWGHHHNDEASIQFLAEGHALIVDSAFGHVQTSGEKKYNDKGHSRWTLRAGEPINYLFRFNRGWICGREDAGRFPYATAYDPVFHFTTGHQMAVPLRSPVMHYRTIVRLAHASFLLVDVCDAEEAQVIRFHVPGSHARPERPQVAAVVGDRRLCILPLQGQSYRMETESDRDSAAGLNLTTEFAFHVGTQRVNAFWISADLAASPLPTVTAVGDTFELRQADAKVEVKVEAEISKDGHRSATLRDSRTGEEVRIRLG